MFAPVYDVLVADSQVSTLLGTRIYRHDDAARDVSGDYATWAVSATPENSLDDRPLIDRQTITVNVYSDDDETVEQIADAVRNALEPFAQCTGVPVDNRDRAETKRYRIALQFDWWHPR